MHESAHISNIYNAYAKEAFYKTVDCSCIKSLAISQCLEILRLGPIECFELTRSCICRDQLKFKIHTVNTISLIQL